MPRKTAADSESLRLPKDERQENNWKRWGLYLSNLMTFRLTLSIILLPAGCFGSDQGARSNLDWIEIAKDGRGFVSASSRQPFVPWGLNYDHDAGEQERLLEDYWQTEWAKVEKDFHEMKELGANVVRIHLQIGKFMRAPDKPDQAALARLGRLVALAERSGLYLDLTGLGNYRKTDTPAWYDSLPENKRWEVQARFWEAVASQSAGSPAIFCYNLMNEPAVPAERQKDWLGRPFTDNRYYVEFISLDPGSRPPWKIGQKWLRTMTRAIRGRDRKHLITVGNFLIDDQAAQLPIGATPADLAHDVDFLSVHLYPAEGRLPVALNALKQLSAEKPVVIEEIAPLHCSVSSLRQFIESSKAYASGWMGFYWGKTLPEYRHSKSVSDELMADCLELFQSMGGNPGFKRRSEESARRSP